MNRHKHTPSLIPKYPEREFRREVKMNYRKNIFDLVKITILFFTLSAIVLWVLSSLSTSASVFAETNPRSAETAVNGTYLPLSGSFNFPITTAGENICSACHEQIASNFAKTVHAKSWKNNGGDGSLTCMSCHGDATEHIEGGGDPTKIKNPAKLKAKEASETCLSCHSQTDEHGMWRGGKHETAGLSCLDCHSAHHSPSILSSEIKLFTNIKSETKLLKGRTEADTCYKCHVDVRRAEHQRSTHLFKNEDQESRITCSSCHNAHGSFGEKLMKTASVNETCFTCHTEKRGPFLWEHAPATESCANCHRAHGSNHKSLLTKRAPMLCQQCHIQGRHQTVAGQPNSVFNFSRSCLACHGQVHGSNHPSGINLQR